MNYQKEPDYLFVSDEMPKTAEGKANYLNERFKKIIINPSINALQKGELPEDQRPTIDTNIGLMTLILCAIEALGYYHIGQDKEGEKCPHCKRPKGRGREAFRKFIKDYIEMYDEVSSTLYGPFRSGLVHSFRITKGSIAQGFDEPFILFKGREHITLNFWKFVKSFIRSVEKYFENVYSDEEALSRLSRHWDFANRYWIEFPRW